MILPWILLILSALLLSLLFVRRLRMTVKDTRFQKHLAQEQADEQEVEEALVQAEVQESEKNVRKSDARKHFKKAEVLYGRGKLEEAEPLLLLAVESDDTHLDAHHTLGMLYMKRGDFPNAELYFSKLVNLKKDPVFYSNLGAALYQQQRLVEAAEAYENAIALDDRRGARFNSLGQVYYELGEQEKALDYFEKAARRNSKDHDVKWVLAELYEAAERMEEALTMLERLHTADPYNKEVKEKMQAIAAILEAQ